MVEEVLPTADDLTPGAGAPPGANAELPPSGQPPTGADPRDADTREAFVRNTAVMSVGTGLSRITGFVRLAALTYALGATRLSDTYNVANVTPNILYELALGGILSSIFVPLFVDWMKTNGRDEAWRVAQRILTLTCVVLGGVALAGAIAAPWIIRIYLSGSTAPPAVHAAQVVVGTFFLRWFMPQIVFYGIGAIANGMLNANRRFAITMFAPILNNLIVTATFLVYAAMRGAGGASIATITGAQQLVLAAGTTLGVVGMTVALWPSLRAVGFRWAWRFDWNHEAVRKLGRLAGWVIVYVVANQVAYLVVIVLAGRIEGGQSVYQYAFMLFQLPHSIAAVSIFTALLPAMAGRWVDRDLDGFRARLSQGVRSTAFLMLPAAAAYIVLAVPITRLLLQRGETSAADAVLIAQTLQMFAIGLVFFSLFQLLSRAFYSMQDTRTPALVNIAAAAVNIGVDVWFVVGLGAGVRGLALGHALSYVFSSLVCVWLLRRRLGGLDGARIARTLAKVLVAAAVTAAAAWGMSTLMGHIDPVAADATGAAALLGRALQVGAGVAAGLLVFVISALTLRIEEADVVRDALTRRFAR